MNDNYFPEIYGIKTKETLQTIVDITKGVPK